MRKKVFLQTVLILLVLFSVRAGSEFTGGYSAPTPVASLTDTSRSGSFTAITYNIAGLPGIISSAKTERETSIVQIGKRLNQFDIVHVQEDFNYNESLYNIENKHLYRTETKGPVPFGDGLNTLSKYPVRQISRIPWKDCTGADCLTPKGFTFTRIEIAANLYIDFYNVHANAYNDMQAASARRSNVLQLSEYIQKHSQNQAVILMGDLNGHYSYFHDNIGALLETNQLTDAWLATKNQGKLLPPTKLLPESNIIDLDDSKESIDKVLYRSSRQLILNASDYKMEKELFANMAGLPLSDHHPVSIVFSWQRAESTELLLAEK